MTAQQPRLQQAFGSRADVAAYLNVPVGTLEGWAVRGRGPAFVRVGRHTRYRWSDVEAWLAAQERGGADPSELAQALRLRELARTVAEYVDGNGADDYPLWAAIEQIAQIGRQEA